MMRYILCFAIALLCLGLILGCPQAGESGSNGPPPVPGRWAKSYGGSETEMPSSIRHTSDGGYILSGSTSSYLVGGFDYWVTKLGSNGSVEWQRSYGRSDDDRSRDIQETVDGGYIVVGDTEYTTHRTFHDIWVLKLASDGAIEWQKRYGNGVKNFFANALRQTGDGGYVVAGKCGYFNDWDMIVLKLASDGAIEWQKSYGSDIYRDSASFVTETDDGGFLVGGYADRSGSGSKDVWILKLTSTGGISWNQSYGGGLDDHACCGRQVEDGKFLIAGSRGGGGIWVLKLESDGSILWQKRYGDICPDAVFGVLMEDDGYVLAGSRYQRDGNDLWIFEIGLDGALRWQAAYGPLSSYDAHCLDQAENDGYVLAGRVNAGDFDIPCCASDIMVITLPRGGVLTGAKFMRERTIPVHDTSVIAGSISDPMGITGSGNAGVSDSAVLGLHTNVTVRTHYP